MEETYQHVYLLLHHLLAQKCFIITHRPIIAANLILGQLTCKCSLVGADILHTACRGAICNLHARYSERETEGGGGPSFWAKGDPRPAFCGDALSGGMHK